MTITDFLEAFQDMLQRDDAITLHDKLKEMEEWDSLAFMAVVAFFDRHFEVRLTFEMLEECTTVEDIAALAQGKIA